LLPTTSGPGLSQAACRIAFNLILKGIRAGAIHELPLEIFDESPQDEVRI
jgi:hypothetical protein